MAFETLICEKKIWRNMITESTRGEALFHEVYKDFIGSVKKELKKRRDKAREPFKKKRKNIDEFLWINFRYQSPKYNSWYVTSGMTGSYDRPRATNHYHCTTNAGFGGSKLYIILRGDKSAQVNRKEGLLGGGYVVSIQPHVFKRMRERNPEAFGDINDNDKLCEKIFTLDEEGIYYDFNWPVLKPREEQSEPQIPLDIPEKPEWMIKKSEEGKPKLVPIILKTLAGLFLGFASQDRAEVRLITYITSSEIQDENERELVDQFLVPAWVCYNSKMFDQEEVKQTWEKLNSYMKDKEDRNVYRLVI